MTSVWLSLVGAVPGLVLSAIPPLLIYQYVEVLTATATPDSGFNVYILGALACSLVAGLLLLCAFVLLFFRQTRVIGIGYLSGMLLVVLALVVPPLATDAAATAGPDPRLRSVRACRDAT
jgi:predicted lipid-binding transport protein (Tim44 family)